MTEQVTKGQERASEGPTQEPVGTQPVAQYFLMTWSVTTRVPGLLGGVLKKSFTATGDKLKIEQGQLAGHGRLWRHCSEWAGLS